MDQNRPARAPPPQGHVTGKQQVPPHGERARRQQHRPTRGTQRVDGRLETAVRQRCVEERPGINPLTREAITIKAKPARRDVRARPLKNLKEMVK